jgi:PKD repeat protein
VTQMSSDQLGVNADASGSTDTDSTPIAWYQFDWGDGTATARQSASLLSHSYAAPGTYTVTATVIDTAGLFSTTSQQITVTADLPPVARLTVTPTSGVAPLAVSADASQSTDTDSTPIATYTFDFGDGTVIGPQAGATAGHTYTAAGTFTVTVTVTDTAGLQSSTSLPVTATAPNLVGNSGFEVDTSGWRAAPGSALTRSSTAHSGAFSGQIARRTKAGRAEIEDSPPWNASTVANTTCTVSAWVEVPAGIKVYARTTELSGAVTVSIHNKSVVSTGGWALLTVVAPIVNGGDSLALSFHATLAVGQTLLIDDVSEYCQ